MSWDGGWARSRQSYGTGRTGRVQPTVHARVGSALQCQCGAQGWPPRSHPKPRRLPPLCLFGRCVRPGGHPRVAARPVPSPTAPQTAAHRSLRPPGPLPGPLPGRAASGWLAGPTRLRSPCAAPIYRAAAAAEPAAAEPAAIATTPAPASGHAPVEHDDLWPHGLHHEGAQPLGVAHGGLQVVKRLLVVSLGGGRGRRAGGEGGTHRWKGL